MMMEKKTRLVMAGKLAGTSSLDDEMLLLIYQRIIRQDLGHTVGSYCILIPGGFVGPRKLSLEGMRRLGSTALLLLLEPSL